MFNSAIIDKIVTSIRLRRILPSDVIISRKAHVDRHCVFEGMNAVHPNVLFRGRLGLGSYIGEGCKIAAIVGRFVSIAPGVKTITGSHPYKMPFVSTSPCFYSNKNLKYRAWGSFANKEVFSGKRQIDPFHNYHIKIGNDCWIGEESLIIGGITIGDGAIVLARAVVTKDVPPYSIVGGVPAKVIGYRYDENTIKFLLETKWWTKDKEWFHKHWELLNDVDSFKDYFGY